VVEVVGILGSQGHKTFESVWVGEEASVGGLDAVIDGGAKHRDSLLGGNAAIRAGLEGIGLASVLGVVAEV
jgi:hypothetical protein